MILDNRGNSFSAAAVEYFRYIVEVVFRVVVIVIKLIVSIVEPFGVLEVVNMVLQAKHNTI